MTMRINDMSKFTSIVCLSILASTWPVIANNSESAPREEGTNRDDIFISDSREFTIFDGKEGFDSVDFSFSDFELIVDLTARVPLDSSPRSQHFFINIEKISGSNYSDVLIGDAQDNVLLGNAGNDIIEYSTGSDAVDGGFGEDLLSFSLQSSGVNALLNEGQLLFNGTTASNIEGLIGSQFNDTLVGDNNDNLLAGLAGTNQLAGQGGNDQFIITSGINHIDGGSGNDTVDFSAYTNDDGIIASEPAFGSMQPVAAPINLNIDLERTEYSSVGVSRSKVLGTISSIENVIGTVTNDSIFGNQDSNILIGSGGADFIDGRAGDDHISVQFNVSPGRAIEPIEIEEISESFANIISRTPVFLNSDAKPHALTSDTLAEMTVLGGSGIDTLKVVANSVNSTETEGALAIDLGTTSRQKVNTNSTNNTIEIKEVEHLFGSNENDVFTYLGSNGSQSDKPDEFGFTSYIYGGSGDDFIYTNKDFVLIEGGRGDDVLVGASVSYQQAGAGVTVDLRRVQDDPVGLEVTQTTDTNGQVITEVSGSSLGLVNQGQDTGGSGVDYLANTRNVVASNHDDTLVGNLKDNKLYGLDGDDKLSGLQGTNLLDGGDGNDTVDYSASGFGISIDLRTKDAQQVNAWQNDTLVSIENVIGTSQSDTIRDNEFTNEIYAGAGNDEIFTSGGNDVIHGGSGSDTLVFENVNSGISIDLRTSDAQEITKGVSKKITEIESVVGTRFNDVMHGDYGQNFLVSFGGDNTLHGNGGNDILRTGDGNDRLHGGNGDDIFEAGEGNNTLSGDQGNDTFFIQGGANDVDGGDGVDTVSLQLATSGVSIDMAEEIYLLPSGSMSLNRVENLVGSQFDDSLRGDAGNNVLNGLDGNDRLEGGGGIDTLIGGNGDDTYILNAASSESENYISDAEGNDVIIVNGITSFAELTLIINGESGIGFESIDGSLAQISQQYGIDNSFAIDFIEINNKPKKGELTGSIAVPLNLQQTQEDLINTEEFNNIRMQGDVVFDQSVRLSESTRLSNEGKLSVKAQMISEGSIRNHGTLIVSSAFKNAGDLINHGNVLIDANGSLAGIGSFVQNSGSLTVNGSLIADEIILNSGILSGSGTIGTLSGNDIVITGDAQVNAGNSPGTLTFASNVFIDSLITFEIYSETVFDVFNFINGASITFGENAALELIFLEPSTITTSFVLSFFDLFTFDTSDISSSSFVGLQNLSVRLASSSFAPTIELIFSDDFSSPFSIVIQPQTQVSAPSILLIMITAVGLIAAQRRTRKGQSSDNKPRHRI